MTTQMAVLKRKDVQNIQGLKEIIQEKERPLYLIYGEVMDHHGLKLQPPKNSADQSERGLKLAKAKAGMRDVFKKIEDAAEEFTKVKKGAEAKAKSADLLKRLKATEANPNIRPKEKLEKLSGFTHELQQLEPLKLVQLEKKGLPPSVKMCK